MSQYALGIDLSLNHAGFALVRCDTLKLVRAAFVTAKVAPLRKAEANEGGKVEGIRIPQWKKAGRERLELLRLVWWHKTLTELRDGPIFGKARYIGIEGYALGGRNAYQHSYAEIGGAVRYIFRKRNIRIHDPLSVKLFGHGNGHATTPMVEDVVWKRHRVDFREWNAKTVGQRPSEDMTVAFVLARMVAIEWNLRVGGMKLSDLEEHEIRVFNRVTKFAPINILARDWVTAKGRDDGC